MGGLPEPRYLEPGTAVDFTDVVIQNRHLFRPSAELAEASPEWRFADSGL